MIDIKLIREHEEDVKKNIKKKSQHEKVSVVDTIKKLDADWRKLKYDIDSLRSKRNALSEEINKAKKEGENIQTLIEKAKKIPDTIKKRERKAEKVYEELKKHLLTIPNMMHKSVPQGKDASENVELKKHGKIPKFSFPIQNHVTLLENLELANFESSARVSGSGFYYLKNELALLNQALIRFAIDILRKKKYEYIETPLLLNEKAVYASMDKGAIEESVYSIRDEDLNLIGTAEQSLLAMHQDDTLHEYTLPKKYFSYSMCFRKEIGSHGINEKGLWRTHQFNKVEQFIFCMPQDSQTLYEELLHNSEEILQTLELPYRIIEICSGDLADWKHKSADVEVYRPTTKEYGEVMSLSNCTDYQATKLNIRYADKHGNRGFVHTLNNTALATSRIMVALIENNQQKDGSIVIPKVLQKYTGFKKISGKN
jgi:seryl-tRNA synthetase